MKKAQEKIFGSFVTLKETYEIKAVDLNLTDKRIEALNVCEYVPVDSKPHGINATYFLRRIDMAIASPQNTVFHLGSTKRVLSDMNTGTGQPVEIPSNISSFKNDANCISVEETEEMLTGYAKEENVVEIVNEAVKDVTKGADGKSAYEIAQDEGFEGTEEEWLASMKGEKGDPGKQGNPGQPGYTPQKGKDYFDGESATVEIGSVETVDALTEASVSNSGTDSNVILNFKIPRGESVCTVVFEIREDGHLWAISNTEDVNSYYINDAGHLIHRIGE